MNIQFVYSTHRTMEEALNAFHDYWASGKIDASDDPNIVRKMFCGRVRFCIMVNAP